MNNKKLILYLFLFVYCQSLAQGSSSCHFVFLFDQAGIERAHRIDIGRKVAKILENGLASKDIPQINDSVKYSIVGYGLDKGAADFQGFTKSYQQSADLTPGDIPKIFSRNYPSKYYSAISFGLVLGLNNLEVRGRFNRTIVIMVSDFDFNGVADTPADEQVNLENTVGMQAKGYQGAIQACEEFRDYFGIRYLHKVKASYGKLQAKFFEVIPQQRMFSINSLVDFDQSVLQFEKKAGLYKANLILKPSGDQLLAQNFNVKAFNAELLGSDQAQTLHIFNNLEGETVVSFELDPDDFNRNADSLNVKMNFWIDYITPFYDCHQLSPNGDDRQGARGLVKTIKVNPAIYRNPLKSWLTWAIGIAVLFMVASFVILYLKNKPRVIRL